MRVETRLQDTAEDIRDIQPPFVFPFSLKWNKPVVWALAGIGLIFLLGWWYRHLCSRRNQEKIQTAWEKALEELDQLSASGILEKKEYREYYYRLSDILRHYIESRFAIMAPERTTEEFIKLMQTRTEFLSPHQQLLNQFFQQCDWVKFAKGIPQPDQAGQEIQTVRTFIRETIPMPQISKPQKK